MKATYHIRQHVEQFEQWRKENHTQEQYEKGFTDDPAYPFWENIESDLKQLFESGTLQNLSIEEQEGIMYLIARSWDVGNIINWLTISAEEPISYLECTESDFLQMCQWALKTKEEDVKCQFVKVLPFLKTISKDVIRALLLDFYKDGGTYTKRMSLFALQETKYPHLEELVLTSWASEEDEFYIIACINILHSLKSKELKVYLKKAEAYKDWEFLQENIQRIKKEAKLK